jgi:hypothetical protein
LPLPQKCGEIFVVVHRSMVVLETNRAGPAPLASEPAFASKF